VQRRAAQPPPPRARADECVAYYCDAAMLLRVRVCARVHCMACMALSQLLRVRSGLRTSVSKSYDHRAFCGPSVTSQVCVCEENIGWSTYKKHRVGHLPDIAFLKSCSQDALKPKNNSKNLCSAFLATVAAPATTAHPPHPCGSNGTNYPLQLYRCTKMILFSRTF
jgi:hypothetical protein